MQGCAEEGTEGQDDVDWTVDEEECKTTCTALLMKIRARRRGLDC